MINTKSTKIDSFKCSVTLVYISLNIDSWYIDYYIAFLLVQF